MKTQTTNIVSLSATHRKRKFKTQLWLRRMALIAAVFGISAFSNPSFAAQSENIAEIVLAAEAVNINTASVEEIADTLKGVGMKKAQAIVQYRKDFGQLSNLEELKRVRGIGDATIKHNATLISF